MGAPELIVCGQMPSKASKAFLGAYVQAPIPGTPQLARKRCTAIESPHGESWRCNLRRRRLSVCNMRLRTVDDALTNSVAVSARDLVFQTRESILMSSTVGRLEETTKLTKMTASN